MTPNRAAHHIWRASLTFLVLGMPGILVRLGANAAITAWLSDREILATVTRSSLGWLSLARVIANFWIQIAVIFVIFKYVPVAIAEVQENRQDEREGQASGSVANMEQYGRSISEQDTSIFRRPAE